MERQVEQILQNLVSNARKYSPDAGAIEIMARNLSDSLEITVADRGQGLPEEEMKLLFQRFYRAPGTATKVAGVGLGLAVSKRLVESMGSTIRASARSGGGMEFAFTLPLAPDDDNEAAPAAIGSFQPATAP